MIETQTIYFLGPEGTNTHKSLKLFVEDFEIKYNSIQPMITIKSVIRAIDEDKNGIAVVPIENSIEGIVREAIDNLIRVEDNNITIMGENVVSVNNCLLSKERTTEKIKTILSHPQALAQCANYLDKNFPNADLIKETSTSAAAKKLLELDSSYAAIANETAAEFYNLNILDVNINDEPGNKTRFILLGRKPTKPTESDKTSIAFATKNRAGALFKVLDIFNKYKINLLYIDSRPSKKNLGEYNFFIDFEGHINNPTSELAIKEIKEHVSFYRFNGSYSIYK